MTSSYGSSHDVLRCPRQMTACPAWDRPLCLPHLVDKLSETAGAEGKESFIAICTFCVCCPAAQKEVVSNKLKCAAYSVLV
jgi:hypothetical protein